LPARTVAASKSHHCANTNVVGNSLGSVDKFDLMKKIEIKYDKKKTWATIAYLTFCVIGSTYFVYLTDTFADNKVLKYIMLPLNAVILYYVFKLTTKILDKESVITLTTDEIEFQNNPRPTKIKWTDIKDIKVENQKDDGKSIMTIVTNFDTKTIDITGLDKKPDELYKLVESFR